MTAPDESPEQPASSAEAPELLPQLLGECVHCGFCLPTCPTYVLWGEEMDSPRGRIHLMQQHADGAPLNGAMVEHFDRCLGCMACVTSCPSGVQYDRLIEMTRAEVEQEHPRSPRERVIREAVFRTFPYPRRLRALRAPLRAYQWTGLDRLVRRTGLLERISPSLAAMERLAPPLGRAPRLPERVAARGGRRATVGMLTGCVQREFFPGVNAATARVLALEGCDVVIPKSQGCCGALSLHAGREDEARAFARRTVEAFEAVDVIVVNSAGCGSAMKEYRTLLGGDPAWARRAEALSAKTRDLAEFLVELGPRAERRPLPVSVAYHDACHLSHAQGIRSQPRALLAGIPELTVREVDGPELCCGSAGTYNVLQPEAASELGDLKAAGVRATGAEVLVAANPGCSMQIATALGRQGATIAVAHTAEVLDASLRGLGAAALTRRRAPGGSTDGSGPSGPRQRFVRP
ncbi:MULTISPECIES: (Fe-S)-binding protein [Thermomonosporaceae]|uniref:(Fe-S)-binding protein n=1 Tax=Thermomonosporaceae TaxID=2012 RepID=UPI00255ADC72|nr:MULTISPECIES: heterodisulfide reductase-related iron-sulfur binding cluster [Thermomonosporaceae]MDL4771417.1 heterodisulfide reductase-related iron-sulfur binding cluster [Actinomadura xylanilytica]